MVIFDIMKDNGFKLAKERSSRYPAQTITHADDADDITLLANTPAQAETLLHNLERASTKYMLCNQRCDILIHNDSSLKLVDKFTYLGSSVINRKRHLHATSIGMDSFR